jgi:hypothetical protein
MAAGGDQDVRRLDVAVDDTQRVGVGEGGGDFRREPGGGLHRQRTIAAEPVAEGAPLDVRHGAEEPAGRAAGVEERKDVGMLEPGLGADLPLEPLHTQRGAQLGVQRLERDPATVPEVLCQVHDRGRAAADLRFEQVASGQPVGERGSLRLRH